MDAETRLPDVVTLTKALIACESVTPAQGSVFDVLEAALIPLGFHIDRFTVGDAPDGPVENLLAVRGSGAPHFAFAGHLDVVPPGAGWTSGAFEPEIRGGLLHGRGAVDMKGAIAAFVAALGRAPARGTQSLIITGDEEGPAIFGTRALIDRMNERGLKPDFCLVGEPTSVARLGDMIKIGRRGSVNIWIDVPGRQGHVAYPHLADNPIPRLVAILAEIDEIVLDEGNEWFQPSNIEATDITVGNPATNVIPAHASARLSIRYNDLHKGDDLAARIEEIVRHHAPEGENDRPSLGRCLPDRTGRPLFTDRRRDRGAAGHPAGAIDHRRHLRRALPVGALPRRRIRADQRDDAQARRGGGDRRPDRADRHLRRYHRTYRRIGKHQLSDSDDSRFPATRGDS